MRKLRPRKLSNLPKVTRLTCGKARVPNPRIPDLRTHQALTHKLPVLYRAGTKMSMVQERVEAERVKPLACGAQVMNERAETETRVGPAAKALCLQHRESQQEAFGGCRLPLQTLSDTVLKGPSSALKGFQRSTVFPGPWAEHRACGGHR